MKGENFQRLSFQILNYVTQQSLLFNVNSKNKKEKENNIQLDNAAQTGNWNKLQWYSPYLLAVAESANVTHHLKYFFLFPWKSTISFYSLTRYHAINTLIKMRHCFYTFNGYDSATFLLARAVGAGSFVKCALENHENFPVIKPVCKLVLARYFGKRAR